MGYPRLYGLKEAAAVLHVDRGNLKTTPGVSDCEYPGGRVIATPLYLADRIDALAKERKQRRQYIQAHRDDVGADG